MISSSVGSAGSSNCSLIGYLTVYNMFRFPDLVCLVPSAKEAAQSSQLRVVVPRLYAVQQGMVCLHAHRHLERAAIFEDLPPGESRRRVGLAQMQWVQESSE